MVCIFISSHDQDHRCCTRSIRHFIPASSKRATWKSQSHPTKLYSPTFKTAFVQNSSGVALTCNGWTETRRCMHQPTTLHRIHCPPMALTFFAGKGGRGCPAPALEAHRPRGGTLKAALDAWRWQLWLACAATQPGWRPILSCRRHSSPYSRVSGFHEQILAWELDADCSMANRACLCQHAHVTSSTFSLILA
jgi:hypothetical protein